MQVAVLLYNLVTPKSRVQIRITGTNLLSPTALSMHCIRGVDARLARLTYEDFGEGFGEIRLIRTISALSGPEIPIHVLNEATFARFGHNHGGPISLSAVGMRCSVRSIGEVRALERLLNVLGKILKEEQAIVSVGTPVYAPTSGVVWHGSKPGAEPYIKAGDHVEMNQTIALFEAMKCFSELEAPVAGIFSGHLVANGQEVSAGDIICTITQGVA